MKIAVTGGTGSLGRALIARLLADGHERVVSVSRDEVKADELVAAHRGHPALRAFIGSVRDRDRLVDAFYGCDVVVHAAALKRVTGSTGYSAMEMVKTNVQGTMNVIEAAVDVDVGRVLVISSDKAVHATNLYGATKFTAECVAVSANAYTWPQGTRVACTRYGNVLGSRGSVLEVWRSAVQTGQPLPITDPQMTRFVLTLDQAVDVVLTALAAMDGGEIFVPKLPAVTIANLAQAVAPDHPTVVIGKRAGGEKLHERLISDEEESRTLEREGLYVIVPAMRTWTETPYLGTPARFAYAYTSENAQCLRVDEVRRLL